MWGQNKVPLLFGIPIKLTWDGILISLCTAPMLNKPQRLPPTIAQNQQRGCQAQQGHWVLLEGFGFFPCSESIWADKSCWKEL